MFIPRGVKRNHANAVYSPEAVKRAKAISSRIWPESTLNPPHTENDMTKTVAIQMQQAQEPQQTSVQHQEELTNEPSRDPEIALSYERSVDGDADDEEPVKETCFEQRFPLDGDPICIICGRYGEYINDTTNNDICSLECKAKDIQNVARNAHHSDICPGIAIPQYTIATNVHAKLTAYHDAPELSALYPKQVEAIRSAHDISIQGKHVPKPVLKFENCQLDDKLLSNLLKFGFSRPTPIQMQAIPAALAGRDIFALAPTSSGKTVSFLVPMITHCLSLAKMYGDIYRSGPLGLILAPTRELATQIEEVAKKLAKELPHMRTALLIGGMPIPNQLYRLKKGVQIVIGTPGRVIELLNHHKDSLKLDTIKMVVLDEVDMMFKLGFNEQVARILNSLVDPGVRQTCFYSATLEAERNMKKYCNKHMRELINIRIGKSPSFEAKKYVKQTFMWVETQSKAKQLMSILRDPKYFEPPVLIFVDSKLATELLAQSIRKKIGSTAVAMHGDLSQPERDAILQQIRQSECDIVVATGILARGIDLPNVRMVINYDMANTVDEYIHQIGRAMVNDSSNSRGKKQHTRRLGWAITFINNPPRGVSADEKRRRLESLFHETKEFYQLKELEKLAPKRQIVTQAVKDTLQSLVDDGLVNMEKIGSSNYFWSYPSAALQKKKNKIEELENVVAQLEKSNADLDVEIAEAGTIREPCELRDMALSELEQERQLQEKNEKELARYKECDPEILLAKEKVAETAKEGANRWTDNIFSIQSHCVDKFGIEKSDFNRNFRISDDFDNIP